MSILWLLFVIFCDNCRNSLCVPLFDGLLTQNHSSDTVVKEENDNDSLSPYSLWSSSFKNVIIKDTKSDNSAGMDGEVGSNLKDIEELKGVIPKLDKFSADSENKNLKSPVSLPPKSVSLESESVHINTEQRYSQNTSSVENCDLCQCSPEKDYELEKCKYCPKCKSTVSSVNNVGSLSGKKFGDNLKNEDSISNINAKTDSPVLPSVNCDLCHCPIEESYNPEKCVPCCPPSESPPIVEVKTEIGYSGHSYNETSTIPEYREFSVEDLQKDEVTPTTMIDKQTTTIGKTAVGASPTIAKNSSIAVYLLIFLFLFAILFIPLSLFTYNKVKACQLQRYYL